MAKPHDGGTHDTPMPDSFKIIADDFAPLDGSGNIPFAGYDKNFAPGSNPDNPQDMPDAAPEPLPAETVLRIKSGCDALGLDVVAFAWRIQKAAWETWKTPVTAAEGMPANGPTPDGCRPNGCHGACLPQIQAPKGEMRARFEEWARDAQELDIHHKPNESPLDRAQYESWTTALAWESWAAATYEAWSILVHRNAVREGNVRVRDPWVDSGGQWWAVVDDGCTYPQCDCEQPEDAGCGKRGAHK